MTMNAASILVVDDEADTCQNLSDILGDLGYQVEVAHDGRQAMARVTARPFDVILLDLRMPDTDGITLYRAIRQVQASAVAILVTAYVGAGVLEQAQAAGAWKVLTKPVDFPLLLGLVERAVGQPLVLVIDDDTDLCQGLWDLLRDQDYRVGLAHDVGDAVARLEGQRYRVVLIDMKLPSGDGTAVLRRVRQAVPDARTVVVTGHREEMGGVVCQALTEGADAVCYKPFDLPHLLATLRQLTDDRPAPSPQEP
ncbi:MAG: response regulator [Gemmataceae bacterium]